MAVNYVTVKTSFKKRDNTDSKFVKVINNDCIDKHKMARTISDQCSLTEADVVAVLQAYESNLKLAFADRKSVV